MKIIPVMKTPLFSFAMLLIFSCITAQAQQFTYLGLKTESNVREAQNQLSTSGAYWPESQLIEGYLYVPTSTGIYRKNLNTSMNDTLWEPYAFSGIPIRDFVKHGDSVLAATAHHLKDSILLLSTDDGNSFVNHTPPFFFQFDSINTVWKIDQNPANPSSIVVLQNAYGVAKSTNYGLSWNSLSQVSGGYQERYLGFHPLDTHSLYYAGEQLFFESYIYTSLDDGNNWTLTGNFHNHAKHYIAYHPTDTNTLICAGEGIMSKSTDRGLTWNNTAILPLYVFSIQNHPDYPSYYYATGDMHGPDDTLSVYVSSDYGDSWSLFLNEYYPDSDGILNLHIYNNTLYLVTMTNGVLAYQLPIIDHVYSPEQHTEKVTIYPNPASNQFTCEAEVPIQTIRVINASGQTVLQQNINSTKASVNCAPLSAGSYAVHITTAKGTQVEKLIIKH